MVAVAAAGIAAAAAAALGLLRLEEGAAETGKPKEERLYSLEALGF